MNVQNLADGVSDLRAGKYAPVDLGQQRTVAVQAGALGDFLA
jgi:hypothetical protein